MKDNHSPKTLFGQGTTDRERQCYYRGYYDAYKYWKSFAASLLVGLCFLSFAIGLILAILINK